MVLTIQISFPANPADTLQGFRTTCRVVATDAQQEPALADYAARHLNVKTVAVGRLNKERSSGALFDATRRPGRRRATRTAPEAVVSYRFRHTRLRY